MACASKESTPTPPQRYMAAFSQRMASELSTVSIDHCYAKPWSSHPDASNARPLQMLFMEKLARQSPQEQQRSEDIVVDVEGEDTGPSALYDVSKARAMMLDCDRHASLLRPDFSETKDDWEDHFASVRTAWSVQQNRIFAKVMKVLQADRLARLSIVDTKNEPIQRRLQIDKAAKRIRFALGNIGWDKTLTTWLHNLLLDKLRGQLLTSYLEVLQKLKTKIPSLIDHLIESTSSKQGTLASESLARLVKRNWDPVINSINQQKLKKLPDNPLLLLIPGAPLSLSNPASNKRQKFWQNQLASMGKVVNVVPINNNPNMSTANCVENMIATTRSKILEMKGHCPGRLIVLIGSNVGALVALQVSLVESVHAVVCLGFSTVGISGNRGEVDDPIYNLKTPTLFVVGQHASTTNLDCLEDIRERLRVDTGLVLVGGADDQLRMTRAKKRSCGLTQAMVDRCIMEEMFEFLGNALFQVVVQPENVEQVQAAKKQPKKRKHKDLSSTAGSQTVDRVVKQPKKIRSMKMASVGTTAVSGNSSVTAGKRASPKKRLGKVLPDGRKLGQKPFLHLTLPVIASTPREKPPASTPSLSEAAAIASAPELSTLLQSIQPTTDQALTSTSKPSAGPVISSKISSTAATSLLASSPSSVPTTTALTLSKFLASSNFLKCGPLVQSGDLNLEDPVSAFDSKLSNDPLSDIDLEDLSGKEDSPVKNESQQQQQPQILIRTGSSSSPFSIPLTFSMASKVLKPGTTMKFSNSGHSSQQVQQLLTTVPKKSTLPSSNQNNAPVPEELPTLQSSGAPPEVPRSESITTFEHKVQPVSSPKDSGMFSTNLPGLLDLPKASVINIGNDTVFLKETPPSKTSAPGTVSIDLGQIASGNSTNAVKLQSSSRISLIPPVRHLPLPISSSSSLSPLSSSPEKPQPLQSPVSVPGMNQTPLASSQQVTLPCKPLPRFALSSSMHLVTGTSTSHTSTTSVAPNVLQATPRFGLSTLSGSQLLSTLSSNAGIIRFKVASTLPSPREESTPEAKQSAQGRDETDGHSEPASQSCDPFAKSSKLPAFIDLTEDSSPPNSKQASKTVTALAGTHTLSLLSMKSIGKNSFTNFTISPSSSLRQASYQCLTTGADIKLTPAPPQNAKSKLDTVTTTTESVKKLALPLQSSSTSVKPAAGTLIKASPSVLVTDILNPAPSSSKVSSLPVPSPTTTTTTPPMSSINTSTSASTSSGSGSSTSNTSQSSRAKPSKSSISYTAKPKPVLASVASTRTRRIKVPKQYDL